MIKKIFEKVIPIIGLTSFATSILLLVVVIWWDGYNAVLVKLLATDLVILGCCFLATEMWDEKGGL